MTTETQGVAAAAPLVARPFAWRRAALGFGLTLVAIVAFATAFAAAYAAFHDGRVLPGVSVGNVSLAGLDRSHAEAALRRSLPSVSSGALTVDLGDQTTTIPYADVGRDYDTIQMLDEAFSVGRGGTPTDQLGQQLRTLISGVSVPVAVKLDGPKLAARIDGIAAAAQVPAVDATITRAGGKYVVSPAVTGERIDGDALLTQAAAALERTSGANASIVIEPTSVAPAVSTAQAQAAADAANNVAARPLTVAVAGRTATIDAQTINGWTHLDPARLGEWKLTIEHAPIDQWVSVLKSSVDVKPTDAGYTFEGNKAVVTQDAPGTTLDATAASSAIFDALNARANGTVSADEVELATTSVAPEFTASQAQSLVGQVKRLSTWTTRYDASNHNGFGQNIRRPTNLIDGTVVQPGETFDYLAVAGPITVNNGYTDGAAIIHGNSVLDGVLGGGLCSSSTTLFNAALRAGFDIGARRNHAYYIDRYPVGLDATIWVNGSYEQSMSFTNDSQYPILIRGINRHNSVTFSIYGVPDGRQVRLSPAKVTEEKPAWTQYVYTDDVTQVAPGGQKRVEFPFRGFEASVERVVTDADGNVIHDDTFRSSYRRVIGEVLIGWQFGDPPPGTVEEPGKPADAQ
jgi:vancomycin resistance protein YoaR